MTERDTDMLFENIRNLREDNDKKQIELAEYLNKNIKGGRGEPEKGRKCN